MTVLADADGIDFAAALIERARRAGADAAQAGHAATERFELDADTAASISSPPTTTTRLR